MNVVRVHSLFSFKSSILHFSVFFKINYCQENYSDRMKIHDKNIFFSSMLDCTWSLSSNRYSQKFCGQYAH